MACRDNLTKILAVERIIQSNSNGVTINRILDLLDNLYGIKAERKSIYSNIAILTRFMPINTKKTGNTVLYYLDME